MRAIFTLLLISMGFLVQAAAPTISTSNLSFNSIEGNSMTLNFTTGNGANRIVIARDGAAVSGSPVNGAYYAYNTAFGTPAAAFTQAGEFVVYRGTGSAVNVTNLQTGHTYYFAIYEFNGTNSTTEYLMIPLNGSRATQAAPTTSASALSISNVTGNSAKLNFTSGNGARRIIVGIKGSSISFTPTIYTAYPSTTNFGTAGASLGGGIYGLGITSANSLTVNTLEPNTTYTFMVIEYNGSTAPVYEAGSATFTFTTNAGPTTTSANPSFSTIEGNVLHFGFGQGNGQYTLVIARKGAPCQFTPANGTLYTANGSFGLGQQVGTDEYIVGITTQNGITISNLLPGTTYYFRLFSYDVNSANYPFYLTSSFGTGSQATLSAPTVPVSNLSISNVTANSFRVNFTPGNGYYRMAVVKQGSPVDVDPTDLTAYSYPGVFGSGTNLGNGNYSVSSGNGSLLVIGGVQPGVTYYVAVYEFNGSNGPVYLRPAATISYAIPNQPSVAASNFNSYYNDGRSLRLLWTNGNGAKRVVVARKNAPVTSTVTDGTAYTASASFGSGTELNPGEFVVVNDAVNFVDLTNLDPASTYYFSVFEYNLSNGSPDYYPTPGTGTASTVSAPTVNTASLNVSSITSTSANIVVSGGSGGSRMAVVREAATTAVDPVDLISYTANNTYGTAAAVTGAGNYVIFKYGSQNVSQAVSNLQPGTNYVVTIYEYNGTNNPMYLRPGVSASFSTISNISAPTVASSAAAISNVDGDRFNLSLTAGNGLGRLVVLSPNPISFVPADGTVYNGNTTFGSGQALGNGAYAIAMNNNNTWNISNLSASTNYYLAVFEYNGSGGNTKYLNPAYTASVATAFAPSVLATNLQISQPTATSLTIQLTAGNGNNRLIVVKDGGPVANTPVNGNVYAAGTVFGNGAQIGLGEYVVSASTNTAVTITNLISGHTYNVSVFEFNGTNYPVYNTTATQGALQAGSPLPVTWKSFTVQLSGSAVVLDWSTATEVNTDKYIVERSADGSHFESIGTVAAAGNSNAVRTYQFKDAQPLSGKSFYRLKQLDLDARASYSVTVQANRAAVSAFSAYPNPAHDVLHVQVSGQHLLQIVNTSGAVVKRLQVNGATVVDVSHLPAGVYYVQVGLETSKLLKD